jgi:hypothetical protein
MAYIHQYQYQNTKVSECIADQDILKWEQGPGNHQTSIHMTDVTCAPMFTMQPDETPFPNVAATHSCKLELMRG